MRHATVGSTWGAMGSMPRYWIHRKIHFIARYVCIWRRGRISERLNAFFAKCRERAWWSVSRNLTLRARDGVFGFILFALLRIISFTSRIWGPCLGLSFPKKFPTFNGKNSSATFAVNLIKLSFWFKTCRQKVKTQSMFTNFTQFVLGFKATFSESRSETEVT